MAIAVAFDIHVVVAAFVFAAFSSVAAGVASHLAAAYLDAEAATASFSVVACCLHLFAFGELSAVADFVVLPVDFEDFADYQWCLQLGDLLDSAEEVIFLGVLMFVVAAALVIGWTAVVAAAAIFAEVVAAFVLVEPLGA